MEPIPFFFSVDDDDSLNWHSDYWSGIWLNTVIAILLNYRCSLFDYFWWLETLFTDSVAVLGGIFGILLPLSYGRWFIVLIHITFDITLLFLGEIIVLLVVVITDIIVVLIRLLEVLCILIAVLRYCCDCYSRCAYLMYWCDSYLPTCPLLPSLRWNTVIHFVHPVELFLLLFVNSCWFCYSGRRCCWAITGGKGYSGVCDLCYIVIYCYYSADDSVCWYISRSIDCWLYLLFWWYYSFCCSSLTIQVLFCWWFCTIWLLYSTICCVLVSFGDIYDCEIFGTVFLVWRILDPFIVVIPGIRAGWR